MPDIYRVDWGLEYEPVTTGSDHCRGRQRESTNKG
jgi:hypothetical protein